MQWTVNWPGLCEVRPVGHHLSTELLVLERVVARRFQRIAEYEHDFVSVHHSHPARPRIHAVPLHQHHTTPPSSLAVGYQFSDGVNQQIGSLPTTLVVRVEQQVRCVRVSVCPENNFWIWYLACWLILTTTTFSSNVKIPDQRSRS